jgi:HPt (histidine-containing phosphotransfer) domain-containing protein
MNNDSTAARALEPLNIDKAAAAFIEDDPALYAHWLRLFLPETEQMLAAIETALACHDTRRAARLALILAKNSSYLGTSDFQQMCARLEQAALADSIPMAAGILNRTKIIFRRLSRELRKKSKLALSKRAAPVSPVVLLIQERIQFKWPAPNVFGFHSTSASPHHSHVKLGYFF